MVYDHRDVGGDIVFGLCFLLGYGPAGSDQENVRPESETGLRRIQVRTVAYAGNEPGGIFGLLEELRGG
jgi:hypothetical protein